MPQQKIRIRLKGYDHTQLDRSAQSIVETAQRTGATITGPVLNSATPSTTIPVGLRSASRRRPPARVRGRAAVVMVLAG